MVAESKQRRRRGRNKNDDKTKNQNNPPAATLGDGPSATIKSPRQQPTTTTTAAYPPHGSLLIHLEEAGETWYKCGQQNPERDAVIKPGQSRNTPAVVQKYRSLADTIYRREVQLHSQKHEKGKDDRWVEATMRKGTLKDRIAAMSVVVSTDPVHKFYALDGLLQMTGCNPDTGGGGGTSSPAATNSRVAQLAAEAVEDLFLNTFLPPDRKLLTLAQRPLMLYENDASSATEIDKKKTKKTLSPRILLLWRLEEMVKDKYDLFLRQYLAHTLQEGTMEVQKIAAVRSAATLLRSVPEGEALVLHMLVNKLGDPGKKVCAAAGHELHRTLQQHPAMRSIVAREVQQLAHRPHLSNAAVYNCITFLNQLKLSRPTASTETNKTSKASDESTGKKSEPSLAASLISTYFRLFEVAIQKGRGRSKDESNKKDSDSEAGMKSRLLSALLQGVNRAHPYLPLADQRMEEHVDALYRVVHTAPPGARTQSLLLLFHLAVGATTADDDDDDKMLDNCKEAVARKERFYRALYSTLSETTILGSGKHLTMYFNLLYKAMKYDTDTSRLVAFAKRIWMTALHCNSAVTAATIFLLNEVCKAHPVLLTCYQEVLQGADALRVLDPGKREPRGALISPGDGKFSHEDEEKRAPGWELSLTMHHFHPSVQKFASTMGNEASNYSGDPLKDFALAPFLDKFAYRNPKSVERVAGKYKRGQSVGERRSGTDSIIQTHFALPVNDPSFVVKSNVDAHDEFFHKFFVERSRRDKVKGLVCATPKARDDAVDTRQAELDALDREEARDIDQLNYGELERQWESDEEEEAFVDSLAQKIMEDSMDGDGPDDLDDEDPDTEGWNDMYGDDSDDEDGKVDRNGESSSELDEDALAASDEAEDDDDAFMENDDDSYSSEGEALFDGEDADGPFLADTAKDSEGSTTVNSGSDEGDLVFAEDDSSSSDDDDDVEAPQLVKLPPVNDTLAAVEDYQELITKSWNEQKRRRCQPLNDENDDSNSEERKIPKKQAGRKKRVKRR